MYMASAEAASRGDDSIDRIRKPVMAFGHAARPVEEPNRLRDITSNA
jgi:hypothetical protein